MVRTGGFEPPHLLALPPQGSVSTIPPRPHKKEENDQPKPIRGLKLTQPNMG